MTYLLHRSTRAKLDLGVSGKGIYIHLADGRRVIDASGGPAVACIGHGNARVADAMAEQAKKIAFMHNMFFTSEPAEALGELLVGEEPGGLCRVFLVSSGSEAMEACLKMALQYHTESGEPQRTHFISRWQGYHGNTFGALSASGHRARRSIYEPVLMQSFSHVSPCFPFHHKPDGQSDENYVATLAQELENEFARVGPNRVAAFVAETVVGASTGCVTAVPGYFKAIREVCDRHGALLILDEVMCGMGRTGRTHAWEYEGVSPDLQAVAKGMGGGYGSVGAMLISRKVIEALENGTGVFVHGHTYQAHPVAAAAALEVQRIIREEDLIGNVQKLSPVLTGMLADRFSQHPHVADIRGRGFFIALEFQQDRETKTSFAPERQFSDRLRRVGLENGIAIYPNGGTIDGARGDHVIIAPPFNVTAGEIEEIVSRLERSINKTVELVGAA
ncbi:MAG: aspartate aminotransferase family protein [Salaquimonas sp.]|nr:aspartate aminotransferase family protein [Salaquimonas sp.]